MSLYFKIALLRPLFDLPNKNIYYLTSNDLQTLERIVNFRDEFLNQTEQDDPKFPFAVVRNKTDLYDEGSSVTEQKSEQYFNEHFGGSTCKHFSTSAKVRFQNSAYLLVLSGIFRIILAYAILNSNHKVAQLALYLSVYIRIVLIS